MYGGALFVGGLLKMERSVRYAGIIGSRTRTERMLDGAKATDWMHYPVGLAIGADGPEEIAFSVTAELLAVRSGGIAAARRTEARDAREA